MFPPLFHVEHRRRRLQRCFLRLPAGDSNERERGEPRHADELQQRRERPRHHGFRLQLQLRHAARAKRAAEEEVVEKASARELFEYVLNTGQKDYTVQRYKGLGEMNADQLWETTMNPATRTLLRASIEDAAAADAIFTMLMGEKVAPRRDFIKTEARKVRNLDV